MEPVSFDPNGSTLACRAEFVQDLWKDLTPVEEKLLVLSVLHNFYQKVAKTFILGNTSRSCSCVFHAPR